MKKNYTVLLDIEATDEVKEWLAEKGLSFSGWLNVFINECHHELRGEGCSWMRKNVSQLTLQEFAEGMQRLIRKLREGEK